jgi:hypothetical protein
VSGDYPGVLTSGCAFLSLSNLEALRASKLVTYVRGVYVITLQGALDWAKAHPKSQQ